MNQANPPALASAPVEPARIVLPRPNLGPEPWSETRRTWRATAGLPGLVVAAVVLALILRRWLGKRAARRRAASPLDRLDREVAAEPSPARRLIASSGAVRAALIAEFGPTWGSRTTEEVTTDPALSARLGDEVARSVVAYLRQVDRAKFAGEDPADADATIAAARSFLGQFPRPGPPRARIVPP